MLLLNGVSEQQKLGLIIIADTFFVEPLIDILPNINFSLYLKPKKHMVILGLFCDC